MVGQPPWVWHDFKIRWELHWHSDRQRPLTLWERVLNEKTWYQQQLIACSKDSVVQAEKKTCEHIHRQDIAPRGTDITETTNKGVGIQLRLETATDGAIFCPSSKTWTQLSCGWVHDSLLIAKRECKILEGIWSMFLVFSPQHECNMQSKYEYHIGLYDYQKVILLNIDILNTNCDYNKYVFMWTTNFKITELSQGTKPYLIWTICGWFDTLPVFTLGFKIQYWAYVAYVEIKALY